MTWGARVWLLLAVLLGGCAHYHVNAPLVAYQTDGGYRFPPMVPARPDPADELFLCLTFSGGGLAPRPWPMA